MMVNTTNTILLHQGGPSASETECRLLLHDVPKTKSIQAYPFPICDVSESFQRLLHHKCLSFFY